MIFSGIAGEARYIQAANPQQSKSLTVVTDEIPNTGPDESGGPGQSGGAPTIGEPGPLRGDIWMTLHTRKAQELVRGRPGTEGREPVVGLGLFTDRLRLVWQAAGDDDPWADWWLIKVDEAIREREALFRCQRQDLDERLARMGSIDIAVPESTRPYRMPLRFASPYAYQAAGLVSTYDALSCAVLAACHVGVLGRAEGSDVIRLGARRLRSLFLIPLGYRSLGIDRASASGGKGDRAVRKMGPLPAAVLRGEHRAPLAPELRSASSGAPDQSERPEEAETPRAPAAPAMEPSPAGSAPADAA